MEEKTIKIKNNCYKCGIQFKIGEKYDVKIINIGIVGGFERYSEDGTMEGDLHFSALCEMENGHIIPFDVDYEIEIYGK